MAQGFLVDKEKMKRESDCYIYCIDAAFELVELKQFAKAAVYYENAARSLRELEKMKPKKHEMNAWLEEMRIR